MVGGAYGGAELPDRGVGQCQSARRSECVSLGIGVPVTPTTQHCIRRSDPKNFCGVGESKSRDAHICESFLIRPQTRPPERFPRRTFWPFGTCTNFGQNLRYLWASSKILQDLGNRRADFKNSNTVGTGEENYKSVLEKNHSGTNPCQTSSSKPPLGAPVAHKTYVRMTTATTETERATDKCGTNSQRVRAGD